MTQKSVNDFISSIRDRLNRHHVWNVFLQTLLALGICMTVVALFYVIPGYAVPWQAWAVTLSIVSLVGIVAVFAGRRSTDQAAGFADDFYGLKDSVTSCSHFAEAGHEGGFYDLQAKQTEKLVGQFSTDQIRYAFPWRLASTAALFCAIALALGFKGPSKEVVQRLEIENATLVNTEAANQQLKELIDELDKALEDEEEKKLLDPDTLRKWVDDLEKTKDLKEAMRQYARLEMKLNKAAERLNQRKDESLMDKAAEELKKAEELKELAEKLKRKKYDKAAKDLKDLKPRKLTAEDLKKLSEKRKELAKLKAVAKRMAQAARKVSSRSHAQVAKTKNGNQKLNSGDGSKSQNGKANKGEHSDGEGQLAANEDLAEMIEDLEEAVEDLDEELEELEREDLEEMEGDFEECEQCQNCQQCEQGVRDQLDKLGKKLAKMARKRKARSKLRKLSQACSQCQSQYMGNAMAQSNMPGGKKAGKGSSDASRDKRDELTDNGQNTSLKGLKGNGPSLTKVESADDGTGVGLRRGNATKREFKRQFESFVDREDVPEDLKAGVKNYFSNIHENE